METPVSPPGSLVSSPFFFFEFADLKANTCPIVYRESRFIWQGINLKTICDFGITTDIQIGLKVGA